MKVFDNSWRTFAVRAVVLGGVVFGAVRFAVARDGVVGGPARSFVTVAGTVTGLPGDPRSTTMRFTFHRTMREGSVMLCSPEVRDVPIAPGGAFAVQVPLDAMATPCPGDMFDGRDVETDVAVSGTTVVANIPINPVPYAHFASVAGQYGAPDCPLGYEVDRAELVRERRICRKRLREGVYDEIVGVGYGPASFWIDRYEASVWGESTAVTRVNTDARGYIGIVPQSGQYVRSDGRNASTLNAWSITGQLPSVNVTWFQARELCRMSGKRLPTNEEWDAAARGTPDPGAMGTDRRERPCLTNAALGMTGARTPAEGIVGCQSVWGAQDMVGNVWEWTSEWFSPGDARIEFSTPDAAVQPDAGVWPGGEGDLALNFSGIVRSGVYYAGLPAAGLRGGAHNTSAVAGVFTININHPPFYSQADMGFRCVIPR